MIAKSHCICTCIKSSKEYCCVWKTVQECISVSSYDDLRYKKINFNSHTIITAWWGLLHFEVHSITLTSLRNTIATIFKSILILFAFIFFPYFFLFEHIMHGHIRERKNTQLCWATNITILLCQSTQMLYMIGGLY